MTLESCRPTMDPNFWPITAHICSKWSRRCCQWCLHSKLCLILISHSTWTAVCGWEISSELFRCLFIWWAWKWDDVHGMHTWLHWVKHMRHAFFTSPGKYYGTEKSAFSSKYAGAIDCASGLENKCQVWQSITVLYHSSTKLTFLSAISTQCIQKIMLWHFTNPA